MRKEVSFQEFILDHTCLCSLERRQMMLIKASSSVPKPFMALRKSCASLTGSKLCAGSTVGVP